MFRLSGSLSVALAFIIAGSAWAATDTKVESSKPVPSTDGKRTVIVDRLTPVVDGEAERFSGRMLIRVTSTDGSPARQRYIEASQVRVVQPPVWIDGSNVCAFVYNVAKNSNGIVYFEPETNRALQVEFVMPARRMGATNKVEQELTSLEVTEFGRETLKVRNVPWKGGSAFPLVLPPLPEFQGNPYDMKFFNQINSAISAYKDWLGTNRISGLEPEQASEAFNADNNWISMLACTPEPYIVAVPLKSGAPAEVLAGIKISKLTNVQLSCAFHAANENEEPPVSDDRFLTIWKSPTSVQIMKETYGAESDTATQTPISLLDISTGALSESTTGTASAAH